MNCSFCFRNKASDNYKIKNLQNYKKIVDKLSKLNIFNSINFAGGEPTLFEELPSLLQHSKNKGFSNSLITNGWKIATKIDFCKKMLKHLDVLGLSIDSLNDQINLNSGRNVLNKTLSLSNLIDVWNIIQQINKNIKFKINTVVSSFNKNDNSLLQLLKTNIVINRWKFLCANNLTHKKQTYEITDKEFKKFINQFKNVNNIVVEQNGSMLNSYIMVNGLGNICCNTENKNFINIFSSTVEDVCNFIENNLDKSEYYKRYKNNLVKDKLIYE